jgi:two-component system, OmpR family, response regulator
MKVLIVDDEEDIRAVARLGLERAGGMDVVETGAGEEAVALATRERPDVVLLDVMMPGMDGPSTLAALRRDPETASIPVVFLTAKVFASEIERLRGLGAAAVLEKPFDPLELPASLRKALGR